MVGRNKTSRARITNLGARETVLKWGARRHTSKELNDGYKKS